MRKLKKNYRQTARSSSNKTSNDSVFSAGNIISGLIGALVAGIFGFAGAWYQGKISKETTEMQLRITVQENKATRDKDKAIADSQLAFSRLQLENSDSDNRAQLELSRLQLEKTTALISEQLRETQQNNAKQFGLLVDRFKLDQKDKADEHDRKQDVRFETLVDKLKDSLLTVRMATLSDLEKLGKSNQELGRKVVESLVIFIRQTAGLSATERLALERLTGIDSSTKDVVAFFSKELEQKDINKAIQVVLRVKPPNDPVDLSGIKITGLKLDNTDISNVNLDFSRLTSISLNHCTLKESTFSDSYMFNCFLYSDSIMNCSFLGSKIVDSDIDNSYFSDNSFLQTAFIENNWIGNIFSDISPSKYSRPSIIGRNRFNHCYFSSTHISSCIFNNVLFEKVEFVHTGIIGCTFTETKFLFCQKSEIFKYDMKKILKEDYDKVVIDHLEPMKTPTQRLNKK